MNALDEFLYKISSLKKKPMVGIFWYHKGKVLGDFYDFATAEIYGNILGPRSNHYEYWAKIKAENPDLSCDEYEYIPRGRVLYELIEDTFIIISSAAIIDNNDAIKAICAHCNILDSFAVSLKTDQHYENPNDLDWEE